MSASQTRQQLDELDALLQRMLALPLNQLDDGLDRPVPPPPRMAETPAAERPWRATDPASLPPGSSVFAAWGVTDMPPEARRALPPVEGNRQLIPELGQPTPPSYTPVPPPPPSFAVPPAATFVTHIEAPPVLGPAGVRFYEVHAADLSNPASTPVTPMVSTPTPASLLAAPIPLARPVYPPTPPTPEPAHDVGILLWPLATFNYLCFGVAGWFGPPGRFVGSRIGRHLLGWTGILCLLGAAAWGTADYLGWLP